MCTKELVITDNVMMTLVSNFTDQTTSIKKYAIYSHILSVIWLYSMSLHNHGKK